MTTFTIEISVEDLQLIGSLLVKAPYDRVVDLIDNINSQVSAQTKKEVSKENKEV